MNRDGNTISFWQSTTNVNQHQTAKANNPQHYDTIIVGAGITGVTLAKELQNRGQKCLIIEKANVGFGTTGGTTAHINNFFDSSYDEIISDFGEYGAKTLASAAKQTIKYIQSNIRKYHISCEYNECSSFVFSAEEKQNDMLEKMFDAHQLVGIDTVKVHSIPFTLPFENAIEIKGQAQFHPLRYINKLIKEFEREGGVILTATQVTDFENKDGKVKIFVNEDDYYTADNLVWATHIPPGNNRFSILLSPYRSYAVTAKLGNPVSHMAQAADLYDPYHYVRYHKSDDDYFIIVGGYDHMTGDEDDTEKHFADLLSYVDKNFKYRNITAKWSSQYYVPADGLAYIGQMPGERNIYISTGYNGNGMTFGSMASLIIPELMEGKITPLSNLLDPGRIKPIASARNVLTEVFNASAHFVKDKFSAEKIKDLDTIVAGEGRIIKHDGDTIAAYRDQKCELHLLSPVCPHTGCNVVWNPSEVTWDCPCHGSRFDIDGTLLNGPAMSDLKKID
ncbi:FAD-dependent oxidoreductase [Chryseobacterium wangxinyae]|uniref:FAD-dependent oxidoreductase n=1 Tax=Chryseobacterium sp. CY350 TaxID=2997336 RepID=UPI002271F514|nr:FAD-dependent oxidoreductase [Chryseobacterium sp. CY350]MCY0976917.1 FAD-dependent oxidoreductase [Chryseobacterium sp. CY350]WBZ96918.1 FAD-dependent oxidoreductase [Chryseobacterium sp. CY350]